jgi:radical SAM protein with 4Fe4S-binding SPASM domain
LLLAVMPGCAPKPLIRVDIDTYLKNQAQYKDKKCSHCDFLKGCHGPL